MRTFRDVIEYFGGPAKFAAAVGIDDGHARVMKHRNSIDSAYWPRIVEAAVKIGKIGVTLELLAKCATEKPRKNASRRRRAA
jgi:hypothetical protein